MNARVTCLNWFKTAEQLAEAVGGKTQDQLGAFVVATSSIETALHISGEVLKQTNCEALETEYIVLNIRHGL